MRIYFTHSLNLPNNIVETISSTIDSLSLKSTSRDRARSVIGNNYDFEEAKKTFQNNVKSIKSCDVVIADCSYVSSGIGYEISMAIDEKKPVIALYNLSIDKEHPRHIDKVPLSLKGNTSKYLILKEYDMSSLKRTLEIAINDAKALADTKFILIIPPTIDRYLEWNVRERGKSKAEITREAIEKVMNTDERYQEYLKNNRVEG